jgi:hypothetical protein
VLCAADYNLRWLLRAIVRLCLKSRASALERHCHPEYANEANFLK